MKKMLALLFLGSSLSSYASCYNDYKNHLDLVAEKIENSNYDEVKTQSIITAGTSAVVTTSTASGSSALVSTSVSAQLLGSLYLGKLLIDTRLSDDTKELIKTRDQLSNSISILKEIRLDEGPFLQQAMPRVWNEVSNDISLKKLREIMLELDNSRLFCKNGEINSAAGMLNIAIEELKNK
jgi:hypothetical protein